MKKSLVIFGLFSLMMVLTSFTTPIGGKSFGGDIVSNEIGGKSSDGGFLTIGGKSSDGGFVTEIGGKSSDGGFLTIGGKSSDGGF